MATAIDGGRVLGAAAARGDGEIARAAAEAIRRYPYYTVFDLVRAEVVDGHVRLTGSVRAPWRRVEIGERVGRLMGVRSLVNDVTVQSLGENDEALRRHLLQRVYGEILLGRASVLDPPVRIIVNEGRVILTGVATSHAELQEIDEAAERCGAASVDVRLAVRADA